MILMDVQMPLMDGFEATRAIRAHNSEAARRIPIVAMTANVFKEDIDRCIESGMDSHIGKPLDAAAVFGMLSRYLPGGGK
jgi:CheY-like chemotaxis protein